MVFMPRKMRPFTAVLQYAVLVAEAGCAATTSPQTTPVPTTAATVRPGIEVPAGGDMAALRGLRVGLITNHTGKTGSGESFTVGGCPHFCVLAGSGMREARSAMIRFTGHQHRGW